MRINIEWDGSPTDALALARMFAAFGGLTPAVIPAAGEPQPETRPRATRATRTLAVAGATDPLVAGYNALADKAGAATIQTEPEGATLAASETAALTEPETPANLAVPETPAAPLADTPDALRAKVRTACIEKGILWVREKVMDKYKVANMKDLTDAQVAEIAAIVDAPA